MLPADVQPPLLDENCANAGFPSNVRIWFAVAVTAALLRGSSAPAPPYTWQYDVSQIW